MEDEKEKLPKRNTSEKKKWEPPRVRSGKLFEANGVSCAKQPGNPPCNVGPTSI